MDRPIPGPDWEAVNTQAHPGMWVIMMRDDGEGSTNCRGEQPLHPLPHLLRKGRFEGSRTHRPLAPKNSFEEQREMVYVPVE